MRRVIVVGAGAAGLMAACAAADAGAQVTVLESNEKAGKKLYITGKGRGNYTNACETADFFRSVLRNPKFLYSAVYGFDSAAMTQFLENNGCPTRMERGQRCFPASDHAYDLTDALVRHLRRQGGRICLHCRVRRILTEESVRCVSGEFRESGQGARTVPGEIFAPGCRAQGAPGESCVPGCRAQGVSGEIFAPGGRAQGVPDPSRTREGCTKRVLGVETEDGKRRPADAVIIATGGVSYPSTGSTGDGYRFARELGLQVIDPQPSLVPLVTAEDWPCRLQGLTLKNVAVKVEELPGKMKLLTEKVGALSGTESLRPASEAEPETAGAGCRGAGSGDIGGGRKAGNPDCDPAGLRSGSRKGQKERKRRGKARPVYEGFGEMLFTHFGVSGPLILSASCHTDFTARPEGYLLHLDLKPALSAEELTARLQREFTAAPGKELHSALRALLPQRLAEEMAKQFCRQQGGTSQSLPGGAGGGIRCDIPVRTLKEKDVKALADLLKDVTMHLVGSRGFGEAIVTRGGVSVKEINPSTMETRQIRGLYWAGEVIDVDAYTGGYNLQIAWSTGHLAGTSAAQVSRALGGAP